MWGGGGAIAFAIMPQYILRLSTTFKIIRRIIVLRNKYGMLTSGKDGSFRLPEKMFKAETQSSRTARRYMEIYATV